jgi:CHAD domain-containing protein
MSYRIDFDHSLECELRRIAGKQVAAAINLLKDQPKGPHEAVHDARKRLKRVRALYRLIKSHAKDFVDRENQRLTDTADELASLRDVAAVVEAAHYLQSKTVSKAEHQSLQRITRTLEAERDRLYGDTRKMEATIAAAISALEDAKDACSGLKLPSERKREAECLASGWQKIDSKARQVLETCVETTESAPFHELRKRSQDRWLQATVLHDLWPAALSAIRNEAKALVDLLGHEHDLAVLSGKIATTADFRNSDEDKEVALLAIVRERQALQRACRDAAKQLFDRKPKRDAEIVELLVRSR